MKFNSWNGEKEIELLNCPFCDSLPNVKHIGNDHTKTRSIEIKCENRMCRATMKNSALRLPFNCLEEISSKNWNRRTNFKRAS